MYHNVSLGRRQMMSDNPAPLPPSGRPLAWPSPGCHRHLGSEPMEGRALSLCSAFQVDENKQTFKKNIQREIL